MGNEMQVILVKEIASRSGVLVWMVRGLVDEMQDQIGRGLGDEMQVILVKGDCISSPAC
jgi:hypothetical protein